MLRNLFLIFLAYVLIRIIIYFFKARKVFKQMMNQAHQAQQSQKPRTKEGEISITYKPDSKKDNKPKDGDYVDFEEVKE